MEVSDLERNLWPILYYLCKDIHCNIVYIQYRQRKVF